MKTLKGRGRIFPKSIDEVYNTRRLHSALREMSLAQSEHDHPRQHSGDVLVIGAPREPCKRPKTVA